MGGLANLEKIDIEPLGLLLRGCVDDQRLSGDESVGGDATLVWHRVILSAPLDVVQNDIPVNREMSHVGQGNAVVEGLYLFLNLTLYLLKRGIRG